ncbi:MAG: peptide chain release factor 3 [Gemmatimonadetes bacterium]|nr:peptide chain release factor 3 [Gemmatimonadota bacterium]
MRPAENDLPAAEGTRDGGSGLAAEVSRRRTFAIISHPDAGKTTLTEKLLLYGGAIRHAGSVKGRKADRHATSDWMEMEKDRGISITASALHFEYQGCRINLLDTPGHQDFSEDTYRALLAADSAIMLLDNRKGVEAQTRKLFSVCKKRRLPIFTFVNKCDRVGADPFGLLDDVQNELGIRCFAATWPLMRGGRLIGLCDRQAGTVHLYDREEDHGSSRPRSQTVDMTDKSGLEDHLEPEVLGPFLEELELLAAAGEPEDLKGLAEGRASPVFFGSALTNFGIDVLLRRFLELAPPPSQRPSTRGLVDPLDPRFSGFVFKVQANMDPHHRDRIAFLRVCSGRFEPGMDATVPRTGRTLRLAQPQDLMAGERSSARSAVAGDVIGLHDRGSLRVGDTIAVTDGLSYPGVPRFSPEHFASVALDDPLRRKHLDRGLRHLAEEGTILLLYAPSLTGPVPLVGAVGRLQFDVLVDRLEREYGVTIRLDPLPFHCTRWVIGPEGDIRRVGRGYGCRLVEDADGLPMMLFDSEWALRRTADEERALTFHDVQPDAV